MAHPIQVTPCTYCGIVFQTVHIYINYKLINYIYIYISTSHFFPCSSNTKNQKTTFLKGCISSFLFEDFFNYIYLKDMYIILKGIKKILFASVLRVLLICKFLNFTKIIKLSKVCILHPTHITIHSFWSKFCQLSVKFTFKQTVKSNNCCIFLFSLSLPCYFFWI